MSSRDIVSVCLISLYPIVKNTTTLGIAIGSSVDWLYNSEPQIYGGNRSVVWSAGKGLGGSSLINGKTLELLHLYRLGFEIGHRRF